MIKLVAMTNEVGVETGQWAVYKGNELLRIFDNKEDAQKFCVELGNDYDRSNRN